jgi:4-hydroxy 2-oxovalerate aldolase
MDIQLLDCTLRDGGYLVDKRFNPDAVHNIINGLTDSGIDFVELGFLQDSADENENVVFKDSKQARKYIPKYRGNTLYTAFADYSRYSAENLDDFDGQSFDCVRACFLKEERKDALDFCREIKRKGYKVFIQPVGVLRYSIPELLDLISDINGIQPFCFGIVDTFGSMYFEDLRLNMAIIDHELSPEIRIGFHSHNNMQLSNALSQEFINIIQSKRDACVDATLYGMGRGAGNTPTELIAEYMNKFLGKTYDTDKILDVIDNSVYGISEHKKWGYDLQMFLSGAFSAHINNVKYLIEKAGLRTRDIRYILSRLAADERARYHYSRLDDLYLECMRLKDANTNDIEKLRAVIRNKAALIIAPGATINTYKEAVSAYIAEKRPIVVSINFIPDGFNVDYIYFNNPRRYDYLKNSGRLDGYKKILTTNVSADDRDSIVIPIESIVRNDFDNSTILLLNLLDMLEAQEIAIAGFDGFTSNQNNYAADDLEKNYNNADEKNPKIQDAFNEFISDKSVKSVRFITPSRFEQPSAAEKGTSNG